MIKKKILISGPSITQKEINYVAEAAKCGWDENSSIYIREFEEKFAKYIGVKYAIATDSCTSALHLALMTLGIGKDDEIIIPDITWVSTISAIYYARAKPVFAEIEKDTWCISPKDIAEKITKRTKAIIPVHLYGHPCDMNKILNLVKKHRLFIIEDAAQSVGALYYGKKTGSFGDFSCFSFHGSKLMVTGEGGMLLTNKKNFYEKAKFLNSQGSSKDKKFWQLTHGVKYRMSNMQAALGTAQLSRIDELLAKKRKIFFWYKERLEKIDGITLNTEKEGYKNNYWMVTIILDKKFKIKNEELMKKLLKYNIDTRPFFYPLSSMPPFMTNTNNKISYSLSGYGINLPCGLNISEREVDYVCNTIKKILKIRVKN